MSTSTQAAFVTFFSAMYWVVMYVQPEKYKFLCEIVERMSPRKTTTSHAARDKGEDQDNPPSAASETTEEKHDLKPALRKSKRNATSLLKDASKEEHSPVVTVKFLEKESKSKKKNYKKTPHTKKTKGKTPIKISEDEVDESSWTADGTINSDDDETTKRILLPSNYITPTKRIVKRASLSAGSGDEGTLFTPSGRRSARLMRK